MARTSIRKAGEEFAEAIARELGLPWGEAQEPIDWQPIPGSPQEQAYYCEADELFFGGSAGGGKTWLLLGLAVTSHRRSIIFRREFPQLREIIENSRKIVGGRGQYNGQDHIWRIDGDRILELGAVQHEWSVEKYQGRAHDLKCLDEVTHFSFTQYKFLTGWTRTADTSQRTRVVATGNPPTRQEGRWVIDYWSPWLKPGHPNPAKPGELRWFAMIDGKDTEVDSGKPFEHNGETIQPRSRSFIAATVDDNPYYLQTGYKSVLQALPEPLRSQMLYGDFNLIAEDDPWQIIPTAWVVAAQRRWKEREAPTYQECLGVDVARGGKDWTIIAPRCGLWIDKLVALPGPQTPDGDTVGHQVVTAMSTRTVPVHIDVDGIGSSPYDYLKRVGVPVHPMSGGKKSEKTDRTGLMGFANKRAEWWWNLRELLDPVYGKPVELPDDEDLLVDLTTPRWWADSVSDPKKKVRQLIHVESKDQFKKRLPGSRSPDRGDAVVYAFADPRSEAKKAADYWRNI